ncbi:MAG: site-specific integrase [Pseudomonadaceae bacterium]|nr:site-specific integrase [Pseudomonadaceae bacterium]
MSKPTKHDHPIHLACSGKTYQYYRTLPESFPRATGTPKQIRWALRSNLDIAKLCTRKLNLAFDDLVSSALLHSWTGQRALQGLENIRKEHEQYLQDLYLPLGDLPAPHRLASSDLSEGYQRLNQAIRNGNVVATGRDGMYRLKLKPSAELLKHCLITFNRLDWPLDTTELEVACWRAAYIFQAIAILERWTGNGMLYPLHGHLVVILALHDYLAYVREDHGLGLQAIPSSLPQSTSDLLKHAPLQNLSTLKHLNCLHIYQDVDGYFVLEVDFSPLGISGATHKLNLKCTSIIVVTLAISFLMHEIGEILDGLAHPDHHSNDSPSLALHQLGDLLRRHLSLEQDVEPLDASLLESTESAPEAIDPKIAAAITAMASLLPKAQQNALQQLLNAPPPAYSGSELPSRALRFGEMVKSFTRQQDREQTWSHPRTRQLNHSRLEVLLEIVGADRVVSTLTRAELIRIRDSIRLYPRNRNKLVGYRQTPLHEVITQGNYMPINPRTGKQYFELLQRILRYARDHELIAEDQSSGLTFNTKGAPSARRRTYNHSQIEKLLQGPVYTLTKPERWRLDDYKFWLPLLGLFQGARLNELCQLRVEDVRQEQGIWIISINDQGGKRLKNSGSSRDIPLHRAVLNAGFLEFVDKRHAESDSSPKAPLFTGLPSYGIGYNSHVASKWFLGNSSNSAGYLAQCGLSEHQLTFHGLRHSFVSQARNQNLNILVVKALVGHTDSSVTGGYGDSYPLSVLNEVLQQIDYQVELNHIHYQHYQQLKIQQGKPRIGRAASEPSNTTHRKPKGWRYYLATDPDS